MLAEKELHGRALQKNKGKFSTSFVPRPTTTMGSTMTPSSRSTPPATTCSTSSTPPTATAAPSSSPSAVDKGKNLGSSSGTSTGHSGLQCHKCQGWGHVQRNCPNQWAYIATADGVYVSTSDVEDDSNHDANKEDEDGDAFGSQVTATYRSIIVKRVLSTQVEKPDKQ
ncbi:putative retrotransposon protein [Panicum miliaceum]|uniref:Retrotransposon protein n=1 Tax=Panicum miliaceum TaxID=4540 RepID=A0A3L6T337_PANMI|nr:putative retrotransposon protein [Panicum miliaceum]